MRKFQILLKIIIILFKKDINYSRFGIRATTKNKLPFFGNLDDFKEFFFGGMGSWGFIYAPFLAEILVQYMLKEKTSVLKILFLIHLI